MFRAALPSMTRRSRGTHGAPREPVAPVRPPVPMPRQPTDSTRLFLISTSVSVGRSSDPQAAAETKMPSLFWFGPRPRTWQSWMVIPRARSEAVTVIPRFTTPSGCRAPAPAPASAPDGYRVSAVVHSIRSDETIQFETSSSDTTGPEEPVIRGRGRAANPSSQPASGAAGRPGP